MYLKEQYISFIIVISSREQAQSQASDSHCAQQGLMDRVARREEMQREGGEEDLEFSYPFLDVSNFHVFLIFSFMTRQ